MAKTSNVTTLEDVIILGRAAPAEISGHRQSVCTGAWSEHRGFLRLYPVDPQAKLFSRWDIVNVDVRRNPKDTRYESWRLASRDQASCVDKTDEFSRELRATLLTNLEDECVRDINEIGRSLGIVRPTDMELKFRDWDAANETVQTRLSEELERWRPETREEFDHEIRVEFKCPNCKTKQGYHNKTLLEWGAYLATLKHDIHSPEELEEFYDLHRKDEFLHWLFVGNQANQRSSFIAINLLWLKEDMPIYDHTFDRQSYPKIGDDFVPLSERE